jgi:hypothetical protein
MAMHAASETVSNKTTEFFHPHDHYREAINFFSQLVETRGREMYLELQKNIDDILGG